MKIFGEKGDEIRGGWRKPYNEELHNSCSSQNIGRMMKSRKMRWPGHGERMGEKRHAYRTFGGKPEGKRPQEKPRRT
jgi:hypothetical protein